jgi:hypothetical protein
VSSSCLYECSCLICVVFVCLRILVSNTYCAVILFCLVSNTYCAVILFCLAEITTINLYLVISFDRKKIGIYVNFKNKNNMVELRTQ